MSYRITRKEVSKHLIIALQLLLEWIEQVENSNEKKDDESFDEDPVESSLLTAAEIARVLNVSKAKAYQLMESGEIPTVRFGRSVRVREIDLEKFILNRIND